MWPSLKNGTNSEGIMECWDFLYQMNTVQQVDVKMILSMDLFWIADKDEVTVILGK